MDVGQIALCRFPYESGTVQIYEFFGAECIKNISELRARRCRGRNLFFVAGPRIELGTSGL